MRQLTTLRTGLRRAAWCVSVLSGTLGMAAGLFAAGAVWRLRLWRLTRVVWLFPAVWTAGGFWQVFRADRRLLRSRDKI